MATGQEGYVPAGFIVKADSLAVFPWYHEGLSRKDAGVMLNKSAEGAYLVRPSETKPGCYSLSVRTPSANGSEAAVIKHFIIRCSNETGTFFIRQSNKFDSLNELIDYYVRTNQLGFQLTVAAEPLAEKPDLILGPHVWEVPIADIVLGKELGHGAFGMVYRGVLKQTTPVAVKTFKPGCMNPEAFLEEADLMKKLKHKNILSLLAIQTKQEPVMIVTELMANGSLLDYLRKADTKQRLQFKDQIDMMAQCADGMHYLESTGFIHRDLAARNVLVSDTHQCKIADFGLSKLDEEYNASNTTRFPVKWTAPEAALYGQYSIKSDVWSFGILVYEIVTFGKLPYPGKNNTEVLRMLELKERMSKPLNCPDPLFEVMMTCFKEAPEQRPTFESLKFQLEDYFFGTSERPYQET